jgi:hypothetical protein
MNSTTEESSFLERLYTSAPCTVAWSDMTGTERVRDCSQCSRKVFNISNMSTTEAEAFLKENGDSQCLAYYRRKDGTIMTDDCPVGLRKIRNTLRGLRRAAGVLISTLLSIGAAFAQKAEPPFSAEKNKKADEVPHLLLGEVAVRDPFKYKVPPIAILKSGDFALGEELSMNGDGLILKISDTPPKNLSHRSNMKDAQPIPCNLSLRDAYFKGNEFESLQMPKAAENYYKLALKIFHANEKYEPALLSNVALSYRNLLLREKRIKEAQKLESEYSLPKP